jgi:hypothetical protein
MPGSWIQEKGPVPIYIVRIAAVQQWYGGSSIHERKKGGIKVSPVPGTLLISV